MVKHIVLWRLAETAGGRSKVENAVLVKQKLEAMRGRIPGLLKLEVGINFCPDEAAADVALYCELESREALAAYQDHPAHVAAKSFIGSVRTDRWVADYEY